MGRLNKYDKKYKKYLSYIRESNEIDKLKRKIPLVELEKPFHRHWESFIDLRNDIKNRKDNLFIYELIKIGYYPSKLIKDVNEVRMIRKGLKSYISKSKHYISFMPIKKRLSKKQYESLTDNQKPYFKEGRDQYNHFPYYNIYIPDFWIKLKVRPKWVTHIKKLDTILERKDAFLNRKLKPYWRTLPYNNFFYKSYKRYKIKEETNQLIQDEWKR